MLGRELSLRLVTLIAFVAFPVPAHETEESEKRNSRNRQISKLIDQLGDAKYKMRRAAEEELFAIGEAALPQLREAAANSEDLEIKFRAQQMVGRIMIFALESRSLATKFAYVEPGEFSMGSLASERGRGTDEPRHQIKITKPFMIATKEVTQDDYRSVMDFNPSWFAPTGKGLDKVIRFKTGSFPVESVTWFDAIDFCNRLSKREKFVPYYELTDIKRKGKSIIAAKVKVNGGTGYRLPTEAEWEYACRAGTKTPYHWGSSTGGGNFKYRVSHYGGTSSNDLRRSTTVAKYKPNKWGLYDMHGNVAEWCWDWYEKSYYKKSPGEDPRGPKSGIHRAMRGGSFLLKQSDCRSASRYWAVPGQANYFTGFRIARNPSAEMIPSIQDRK